MRRPTAIATAVSIALHAALLGLAAAVLLPADTTNELISIALVGPGGGGGGGSSASAAPAAAPPVAESAPAAAPAPVVAPPAPPPVAAKHVARAPRAATRPARRPTPPRSNGVAALASAPHPPPPAAPAAGTDVGSGGGTGTGRGTGSGTGSGSGSGSGGGTGSGSGGGTGAGSGSNLRAYCLSCPEPQYPRIARARGWQGVVDVDLSIRPDGTVDRAAVAHSSGYGALDDAALAVARRSRFQLVQASAGGVRGRIPYTFRLTSTP